MLKTHKNSLVLTNLPELFTQNSQLFFENDIHKLKKKYTFIALKIVTPPISRFFET